MSRREPVLRIMTAEEVSAGAAERWRAQYQHWEGDRRFADGKTKRETDDALNVTEQTPDGLKNILNAGWTHPRCDVCGEPAAVVAHSIGGFDDEPPACCLTCAEKIVALLRQFPRAAERVCEPIPYF
jgi:hypothetical protein